MLVLRWIVGVLKAFNSNTKPVDMGAGLAFALLLSLMPAGNLLWVLLFCLTFFLRVHTGTMLIFLAVFKLFIPLFDPLLHFIGLRILSWPALQPAFTMLYELPVVPFTQFNNTLVMGGLAAGLILWLPVCLLFMRLVHVYRDKLREKIHGSKFMRQLMQLPLMGSMAGLIKKIDTAFKALA